MVGTCASTAAPTTSPMIGLRVVLVCLPSVGREDAVLDVGVEVEGPDAALAPDARLPAAAERCAQIADEEAVDPDRARGELGRHPLGPGRVAGDERRGQPEP